ncbi:UDP-N-acetylmuramoyl-L-alanyl-D-glutamate--2,6-diaminopimelate ligase [Ligilactobacillus sp. WILCCON 0076]|uniref:UDP-N-acetylmuramoyl-L-alanyl-D-glutamate--2,6-diaminopimelate ligase n=1 Tax=Ligilactobacillus ubinensis TaxID=2876789 RepID=A0A9X2JL28_9LACO|nr:UDP-N-acetylmuramoyl-L-alanyl-D-glutamate--2,6-diaminopimelate ligase [Ligilactobacillus ubinensis]MCP0886499.1 UDP-N-acetylmuramoyl-L-alanyl-D-glutamate--2,6-diaminopimelate ligase [Ligilactobacillus ubinensis]
MLASELLKVLKFKQVIPEKYSDFSISLVTQDTREVVENSIFIAISGYTVDGHQYVRQAIEKGAKMIIAQKPLGEMLVPVVYVENTNRAMALLSNTFYGAPSHAMKVIGVTGTNGKTTVTHMIDAIFRDQGEKTGLVGTMYRRIGDEVLKTANTTPDIITLQRTMQKMVEVGVSEAAIEVSSVALVQGRVWGVDFDIAVFTNFTQDHLDYHKTMDNYAHAKSLLFSQLGNGYTISGDAKVAIFNNDDSMSQRFMEDTAAQVMTYGIKNDAIIRASNIKIHAHGTDFDLKVFNNKYHLHVKTIGMFNVYNLLAAYSAAYVAGVDSNRIVEALENFSGVKGRLQLVTSNSGASAIVDYSHTPDGLLNALKTINEFAVGKVYCVIGCGGDRDHDKRPKMAKIAVENCDYAIFTSDNPRTEEPKSIIDAMLTGVPNGMKATVLLDRRQAIQTAIMKAKPNDIVLIAGKGHEDYQIIGHTKHHFDDVEEANKAFKLKEKN